MSLLGGIPYFPVDTLTLPQDTLPLRYPSIPPRKEGTWHQGYPTPPPPEPQKWPVGILLECFLVFTVIRITVVITKTG